PASGDSVPLRPVQSQAVLRQRAPEAGIQGARDPVQDPPLAGPPPARRADDQAGRPPGPLAQVRGAESGSRTRTSLRTSVFETDASAIPPPRRRWDRASMIIIRRC